MDYFKKRDAGKRKWIKKNSIFFLSIAVCLFILRADISIAATKDAILFFDKTAVSAKPGEPEISLVARVNPGSNTEQGINAVQLDIIFDPAIVHMKSIEKNSPFEILVAPDIAAVNESGLLTVPLFIAGSQVTKVSDVATIVFIPQGVEAISGIEFAPTADASIKDGAGTPVVGTRDGVVVNKSKITSTLGTLTKNFRKAIIILIIGIVTVMVVAYFKRDWIAKKYGKKL